MYFPLKREVGLALGHYIAAKRTVDLEGASEPEVWRPPS